MNPIREDGHVYFIRQGSSSQKEVKHEAFENNHLLIGFDKEVGIDDLNGCIKSVLDSNDYKSDNDPFSNLKMKNNNKKEDVPKLAKDALRAFSLARPGIDYFFTFYDRKLYWGTPTDEPHELADMHFVKNKSSSDKDLILEAVPHFEDESSQDNIHASEVKSPVKKGPYWRIREIEWHYTYVDEKKGDLWTDQVTGIISRINRFPETFSELVGDTTFSDRKVFFDQINGRLPHIVKSSILVEMTDTSISSLDVNIQNQVRDIAVEGRKDSKALIYNLCKYLHPGAFEIFIDIAYSSKGYSRCSELGETMKAIDMEYVRYSDVGDMEHFAVQVKSKINESSLEVALTKMDNTLLGFPCVIVTHGDNEALLEDIIIEHNKIMRKDDQNTYYYSQYSLKKLKELIEESDSRLLLTFLILNLAGRRNLDGELKELLKTI